MKIHSLVTTLLCASAWLPGQQPRSVPTGCDYGQILGVERNQTIVICSESAAKIPAVLGQLKRLNELAVEDERDRRALHRFVKQINETANLVKNRNDELARSVYALLGDASQHSDSRVIQDLNSLTDRMDQVVGRLNALQQDPASAPRVQQVLATGVGENLARLHPDEAAQILESIGLLSKKIDDLATRIDCSAATPDAMAIAIKGLSVEHTISMWRCHPENTVTSQVQTAYVLLFTTEEFPQAEPFLDRLIGSGFNPLKEIKPLRGPLLDASNPNGPLLARYFYAPVYRPMMEGNLTALHWLITHAPPGYWNEYPSLMEDATRIMGLPWERFSAETAAQVISVLRHAGVAADTHDNKAFRDAYQRWLSMQLPEDLRASPEPPNQIQLVMARQMGYSARPRAPRPGEAELWKVVSDALAPDSAEALHRARLQAVDDMTERDLNAVTKVIQEGEQQLSGHTWWRKLPETRENLLEAQRRQAANVFDTFGYVAVGPNDLRDDDVARNQMYPNCGCVTVRDVRDRIAKATQRRDSLLRFRAAYAN